MMKYQQVAELFSKAKYPSRGKPVASNTRVHMGIDGDYALVLHNTPIITWHLNGTITLNDGGWNSPTTYRRMNQFLPSGVNVYRKDWKMEMNLKRSYIHNAESTWTLTKHITKPVYDAKPTNYICVSPMKQLYGRRASLMILTPLGNGQDEYSLTKVWQVIV
jgi:hypothetical protein